MAARLESMYKQDIRPKMMEEFSYKNIHQVPKLEKITLNMGLGEAVANPKILEGAVTELGLIAGQKPIITRARKSISNFKLREGMAIGCSVTLRQQRMYDFFDRLINLALPRVRDFRGLSPRAFDRRGNYTLGVREEIIFHEIDYDKIDKIKGLNVTICTSAETDEEAKSLLAHFGFPFRR